MKPDIEKYLGMMEDWDMPREQKIQLINDLWHIMENFVDRAFGIHPVQQVMQKNPLRDLQDSEKIISSSCTQKQNKPPPPEQGVRP